MDDAAFVAACARCAVEETFFPVPATLIKHARAMSFNGDAAHLAWEQVRQSVARWVPGSAWEFSVDEPTRAGLNAIGGAKRLVDLDADDAVWLRKEFVAAYQRWQRAVTDARLGLEAGENKPFLLSPEVMDDDRQ